MLIAIYRSALVFVFKKRNNLAGVRIRHTDLSLFSPKRNQSAYSQHKGYERCGHGQTGKGEQGWEWGGVEAVNQS